MSEKYGVVTEEIETSKPEVATLRRTPIVAHTTHCPWCTAPLADQPTNTKRCPNCGTAPFER
jgi:rubrerythrin